MPSSPHLDHGRHPRRVAERHSLPGGGAPGFGRRVRRRHRSRPARRHDSRAPPPLRRPHVHRDAGRAVAPRPHRPLQRRLRRDRDGVPRRGAGRGGTSGRVGSGDRRRRGRAWCPVGRAHRREGEHEHQGAGDHRRVGGLHAARPGTGRARGRDHRREVAGGRRHRPRAHQHARLRQQRHQPQQLVRSHRQRLRRALLARGIVGRDGHRRGGELRRARQRHRYR